ncbi:MAG: tRNA pseudouridine(38-40) synthase TruA [Bacteroidetes bacterium]|nr:tRNA pseudouridine(38-40) synthase TruA [Bacteroidota bacterium]
MPRFALEVAYDGTAFHGSQIQGDTPTVQLALNQALSTLLRQPIETYGASRTDEGVHALGNFYHLDLELSLSTKSLYQLNALLPNSLGVKNIYRTADNFNVRFDAISRQYRYRIYRSKNPFLFQKALHFPYHLDLDTLQATAKALLAYQDFESFCKRNAQTHTHLCTIYESYWQQSETELHYVVKANRFLRGMVRGLVGTQLRAGRGKYGLDEFHAIVAAKDCRLADFSPKGWGLYLEKIEFPEGALLPL